MLVENQYYKKYFTLRALKTAYLINVSNTNCTKECSSKHTDGNIIYRNDILWPETENNSYPYWIKENPNHSSLYLYWLD